jgi:hypothetical protein
LEKNKDLKKEVIEIIQENGKSKTAIGALGMSV